MSHIQSYFADVVQGGQLQQLGQNVERRAQEAAKFLTGVVEVECYLENTHKVRHNKLPITITHFVYL